MGESVLPVIDKKATGNNIKRLLRLKKMSVIQLQEILKMPSGILIYKWCRGEHIPSIEYLLQLSRIFECNIEDILMIQEDK